MSTKRFLWALMTSAILIAAGSGCLMNRMYNPGPTATYLWIPFIGEWPIYDPYLDGENRQNDETVPQETPGG